MSVSRPSAEEQKRLIHDESLKPLQVNDVFHLIPMSWWQHWCRSVNYEDKADDCVDEVDPPDSIDNHSLLTEVPLLSAGIRPPELKGGLVEMVDYRLINDQAFSYFDSW